MATGKIIILMVKHMVLIIKNELNKDDGESDDPGTDIAILMGR